MAKKGKIPLLYKLFFLVVLFVLASVFYKSLTREKTHLYAKVKVSQGLWWASSNKPNIWYATAIKKGDRESGFLGSPIAEVTEVRYYPYYLENTPYEDKFDIYLTLKLAADYNQKSGKAVFKRSDLSVGSPIELVFPSTWVSGTIIELSRLEFDEAFVKKTVILTKRFAYPWEYDAVKIGDTYFDGTEEVFRVLGKEAHNTGILSVDAFGNYLPTTAEPTRYVSVRAEILVKEKAGKLIFGEEKIIVPGAQLNLVTPNLNFQEFVVSKIL